MKSAEIPCRLIFGSVGILACSILFVVTAPVSAEVLDVPAEYPTIQAAIDAAVDGDSVMIAPGIYTGTGNRSLDPGTRVISIIGENGADQTIIDCEGQARALWIHGGQTDDFVFSGITVLNGFADRGAGFFIEPGSRASIVDCVFDQCTTSGGSVHEGQGNLRRTRFSNCDTGPGGIAWGVHLTSGLIEDCEFVDSPNVIAVFLTRNSLPIEDFLVTGTLFAGPGSGLGFYSDLLNLSIEDCLFTGVSTALSLNAAEVFNPVSVSGTTFGSSSSIYADYTYLNFERSILDPTCVRVWMTGSLITMDCCLYNPALVAGSGLLEEIGEQVYGSPEFCDPVDCRGTGGDYRLSDTSPCLPENSPCGELIGAFGIGCGVTGVGEPAADTATRIIFTSPIPARNQIQFQISPSDGVTILEILDIRGRRVARREIEENHGQEIEWDLTDSTGGQVPTGIYFLSVADRSGSLATAKFVWMAD